MNKSTTRARFKKKRLYLMCENNEKVTDYVVDFKQAFVSQ